ncbi:MAG: hypothetical protein SGILL_002753 [Bacillariaceae sp.]
MSDEHCEEQEMEAEALTAIFDDCMEVIKDAQPFEWAIKLWPEQMHGGEEEDEDPDAPTNHVGIQVLATIPLDYPETSLPEMKIKVIKGLTDEHEEELLALAMEEAESNQGMPVMYAVCERLREWLAENNEPGMDDKSMYAQMMKREKEKEREATRPCAILEDLHLEDALSCPLLTPQKAQVAFEAQKQKEELTEAEAEELAVRKRRAEGTPCTDETFHEWAQKFDAEMEEERQKKEEEAGAEGRKKGSKTDKVVDKSGRQTGFEQFSGTAGTVDWEAMEAATENAQRDEDEEEDEEGEEDGEALDVDEDLFMEDDDLDDLDFDDDDDDEEEPDI